MWTDDPNHKFYKECQEAYKTLSETTDARGLKLKIHKVIMPATSVYMTEEEASTIDPVEGVLPRTPEDAFEPSYLNFLPINGAVLVPQFGDPNDARALKGYPSRLSESRGHRHHDARGHLWWRQHPLHHPAAAKARCK